jgi:hypothetical protein
MICVWLYEWMRLIFFFVYFITEGYEVNNKTLKQNIRKYIFGRPSTTMTQTFTSKFLPKKHSESHKFSSKIQHLIENKVMHSTAD